MNLSDSEIEIMTTLQGEELLALFTRVGLSELKAKETIRNEALSVAFRDVIAEVSLAAAGRAFAT